MPRDEECAKCRFLPVCLGGCSKQWQEGADKSVICTPLRYNHVDRIRVDRIRLYFSGGGPSPSSSRGFAEHLWSSPRPRRVEQHIYKHFTSVSPDASGHFSPTVRAPMLGRSPLADMVSSKRAPTGELWIRES